MIKWAFLAYCYLAYRFGWYEHVANMIERFLPSMSPTFIKAGQLLAQRMDVLPQPIQRALNRMLDDVPADESLDIVVYEKFKDLPIREIEDMVPGGAGYDWPVVVGSGSISQVYLFRGYAIKVRRAGILDEIDEDFGMLRRILGLVFSRSPYYTDMLEIVEYLQKSIIEQCNFVDERKHQMVFHSYKTPNVHVPEVFEQWCDDDTIVMEYVKGTALHNITDEQLNDLLQKTPTLSEELAKLLTRPLTFDHIFHGDLHPGNVLVTDRGLCILDFGWICKIDDDVHKVIMKTIEFYRAKDSAQIIELVAENAFHDPITDPKIKADLLDILDRSDEAECLVPMVNELVDYTLTHQLRMDTRYLHILIARVNGYYLFSKLKQDATMVLNMFQENFLKCSALKTSQSLFTALKSFKTALKTKPVEAKSEN